MTLPRNQLQFRWKQEGVFKSSAVKCECRPQITLIPSGGSLHAMSPQRGHPSTSLIAPGRHPSPPAPSLFLSSVLPPFCCVFCDPRCKLALEQTCLHQHLGKWLQHTLHQLRPPRKLQATAPSLPSLYGVCSIHRGGTGLQMLVQDEQAWNVG